MKLKTFLILSALWLLGQGAPVYEWGETVLWPVSDHWYTWFSYFGYNVQLFIVSFIALRWHTPFKHAKKTIWERMMILMFMWYVIIDTAQMLIPGWYSYNAFWTEAISLCLSVLFCIFVLYPRLLTILREQEAREEQRINDSIS